MTKRNKKEPLVGSDALPVILLTNERTQHKANQILMFYQAATLGQLGYMDGLDPDSGEIVPLLVGLEPTEGGMQYKVYPLAKLISKTSGLKNYLVPAGDGTYIDYSVKEEIGNGISTDTSVQLLDLGSAEEAGPASES